MHYLEEGRGAALQLACKVVRCAACTRIKPISRSCHFAEHHACAMIACALADLTTAAPGADRCSAL